MFIFLSVIFSTQHLQREPQYIYVSTIRHHTLSSVNESFCKLRLSASVVLLGKDPQYQVM